jgi:2-dehydropantoate 2-reductase
VRVTIVGAGAIGSLFGAYLSRGGHEVELIGRPEFFSAVRDHGLWVQGATDAIYRVEARSDFTDGIRADAVVVTVKTFDLEAVAESVARALPSPVPLLLPQNGLGIEAHAIAALTRGGWSDPAGWIVRAVLYLPATLVAPGVVREGGTGTILLPTRAASDPRAAHTERFRRLFHDAGFRALVTDEFDREVWRKVLVNAAINPVTASLGVPNGALASGPARERAMALLDEARRVAGAEGFEFSHEEAAADLERVVHESAPNHSSMLQDLERGRPTEIEAISGELLRIGVQRGLDLPATRAIRDEVLAKVAERASRPQPS